MGAFARASETDRPCVPARPPSEHRSENPHHIRAIDRHKTRNTPVCSCSDAQNQLAQSFKIRGVHTCAGKRGRNAACFKKRNQAVNAFCRQRHTGFFCRQILPKQAVPQNGKALCDFFILQQISCR